ncbi:MAG: carbohydrate ABC transporter permease [Caldilineaceae bacterium]|nr:carbohydrate ABC transporter permease [Caldilineaceae bacterium]
MNTLTRRHRLVALLSHIVLAGAAVFMIAPFLWMLTTSVKGADEVYRVPPTIIPAALHWENFTHVIDTVPFGRFYVNTIIVTTVITVSQVTTAILAAYVFARIRFPGRDLIFYLYLATLIVPTQVTMLPLFLIVSRLGWIDTYQALIVPFMANAFSVFFLRQFFLTLPTELEDAARMDGCSRMRFLWQIMLPLSRPALATITLFIFLGFWDEYLWPLVVTNTSSMRTLAIGLRFFIDESGAQYHYMMAAALMAVAPVIAVFFLAQRQFIEGIALTGIKG